MAKRKTYGVNLSAAEIERFEAVVAELGVNTHSLMKWAVLDFLTRFEAGEVMPKMETQHVLVFPDAENGES